jgi:hypothetical protein
VDVIAMERFLPGLIIAGVAGIAGIAGGTHSQPAVEPTYHSPVLEVMRDAPVVDSNTLDTQTHRGFAPAQESVCETVR